MEVKFQAVMFYNKLESVFILGPQVSNVQSRSALVSWTSVSVSGSSGRVPSCSYELQLMDKDKGRDGKYKVVYR